MLYDDEYDWHAPHPVDNRHLAKRRALIGFALLAAIITALIAPNVSAFVELPAPQSRNVPIAP